MARRSRPSCPAWDIIVCSARARYTVWKGSVRVFRFSVRNDAHRPFFVTGCCWRTGFAYCLMLRAVGPPAVEARIGLRPAAGSCHCRYRAPEADTGSPEATAPAPARRTVSGSEGWPVWRVPVVVFVRSSRILPSACGSQGAGGQHDHDLAAPIVRQGGPHAPPSRLMQDGQREHVRIRVFCQVGVGRFGVSFSPCERRVSGRFGVGRSCWLLVIALVIA